MLKAIRSRKHRATGCRFAIVASRYNERFVGAMLRAAKAELKASGASHVTVVRVPGAFEIPVVAARLARSRKPDYSAVICLGVILRGETTHAEHIGVAVTQALAQIQVGTGTPVIHEVLLLENEVQAQVRCRGRKHNRGTEAARTAVEMAQVVAAF